MIHDVVLQDGSICRKHMFCRRFFKIRMGDWSGKGAKKKSLRAISTEKTAQWVLIWSLQCSKKWIFEGRLLKVGFQKCASRSSGEHIFAKRSQKLLEIAFAFEFALAFPSKFAFAKSDPILDGSMCESNTFCRAICISKQSGTQRNPAEISGNQRTPQPRTSIFYQSVNPSD